MGPYLWILWLSLAIFFLIIEGMTVEIVSLWFTGGSLSALVLSLFRVNFWWQLITFIVVSIILIVFTRPIVIKYFKKNAIKTNVDSFIGEHAVITKDVKPDDRGELIYRGQFWLAISSDNTLIEKDSKVIILAIEGVKMIVKKI